LKVCIAGKPLVISWMLMKHYFLEVGGFTTGGLRLDEGVVYCG